MCRAALQADVEASRKFHIVVFDLLELGGDDVRGLPWTRRTELLREAFPTGDRLRLIRARPASRVAHDQFVALGFEGTPGNRRRGGPALWVLLEHS